MNYTFHGEVIVSVISGYLYNVGYKEAGVVPSSRLEEVANNQARQESSADNH